MSGTASAVGSDSNQSLLERGARFSDNISCTSWAVFASVNLDVKPNELQGARGGIRLRNDKVLPETSKSSNLSNPSASVNGSSAPEYSAVGS